MLNKKLQKKFTIADNRIMQSSNLSFEARGLYFYMLSLPNGWEFSEARLAKNGGIGLDKCKRILKELFEIGLIKREFTHNEKGYKKSIYTLFDFDTIENPSKNNPTLENPLLENPTNNKEIVTQIKKEKKEIFLTKKEKNIKKEKKSISEQALELYQTNPHFSLDDWNEWCEYKSARCKNLTLQTFKQNFNFLIGLGSSARASISQSINHNWQGLFEVKQNHQSNSNNNYFKGLSAEQQFASIADGSYNPDDYDFSKLPIYS